MVEAHRAFLDAGADIITTASYQASPEGFARAGFDAATAAELIRLSVQLAQQAIEASGRPALIAGSVGPYGAMLANGAEYTGDYGSVTLADLRAFHRPRLEMLAEAGVDVLAVETVPSLLEVEALLAELDRLNHPVWLSLTTDGVRTRRGEPAETAFSMAKSVPAVVAVGANCTDPAGVGAAVKVATDASGKAGVVYPNSGEGWDAVARAWTPAAASQGLLIGDVDGWVASGARIIGGCCRVGPEQIAAVAAALR